MAKMLEFVKDGLECAGMITDDVQKICGELEIAAMFLPVSVLTESVIEQLEYVLPFVGDYEHENAVNAALEVLQRYYDCDELSEIPTSSISEAIAGLKPVVASDSIEGRAEMNVWAALGFLHVILWAALPEDVDFSPELVAAA